MKYDLLLSEIIGKPMIITSGIRCEAFNSEIKGSLVFKLYMGLVL